MSHDLYGDPGAAPRFLPSQKQLLFIVFWQIHRLVSLPNWSERCTPWKHIKRNKLPPCYAAPEVPHTAFNLSLFFFKKFIFEKFFEKVHICAVFESFHFLKKRLLDGTLFENVPPLLVFVLWFYHVCVCCVCCAIVPNLLDAMTHLVFCGRSQFGNNLPGRLFRIVPGLQTEILQSTACGLAIYQWVITHSFGNLVLTCIASESHNTKSDLYV